MTPDFQSIILPLFQAFKDYEEKTTKYLREKMIEYFKITEDGKKVLSNPPDKITISFLKQFENFQQIVVLKGMKQ